MTIYALSTVPGKSGVAVVRVSGQQAITAIEKITKKTIKPRIATVCNLYDSNNEIFDEAVVIFYEGQKVLLASLLLNFRHMVACL